MGYKFKLEDANIVAFITTPNTHRGYTMPTVTKEQLYSFLESIKSDNLISSDESWKRFLINQAEQSIEMLDYLEPESIPEDRVLQNINISEEIIMPRSNIPGEDEKDEIDIIEKKLKESDKYIGTNLKKVLEPIKSILSNFDLFGIVVYGNNRNSNGKLKELSENYAKGFLEDALILMTEESNYTEKSFLEILSAAKPFSILANNNSEGILFWDKKNNSAFLPFEDLIRFVHSDQIKFMKYINMQLNQVNLQYEVKPRVLSSILHLSDLHFGDKNVSTNLEYLISHIETLEGIKHIVITGDLIENPDTSNCHLFQYFMHRLNQSLNVPITVVPGNHDYRKDGWLSDSRYQNCDLGIDHKVIVDDSIRTIFFCINSNVDGNRYTESYLARGHVSNEQLIELGKAYQDKIKERGSGIKEYNKIALIHHHPFPFTYETKSFIKKAKFYMHDKTLMLNNADDVIKWCNDININLILHGHKHLQRYVKCEIIGNRTTSTIDSLGCGTSTGTGGSFLSYNLISINDRSRQYNYGFFRGKSNGSGFYPEYLKVYKENR